MANNNSSITIDGVVITKSKNLYTLLGVGKHATYKEVNKKASLTIGKTLHSKIQNVGDCSLPEVQELIFAYKVLSDSDCRNNYDAARKNSAITLNDQIEGQNVDASTDYYAVLGVKPKVKKEQLKEALEAKLGQCYTNAADKTPLEATLDPAELAKITDLTDAHKILSNSSNRKAYNQWLKRNKIKVTGVSNGFLAAINGRKILIGAGVATLAAAIIAGVIFWDDIQVLFKNNDNKVPDDSQPSVSQMVDDEEQEETREFYDVNDAEQMEQRTAKIFASMEENGIMFTLPTEDGTGERNITEDDIKGLLYWASYPYLNDDNIDKACDMDTAALLISQICANYEMKGETSQRIAGITGLPEDPNAGQYDFDLGQFFIDGSIQQKMLSRVSAQDNQIKNNPTSESRDVAIQMFKEGTLHFTFDDTKMEIYNSEFDTANFMWGMRLATSQSLFDLQPSFVYGDATYNDFNVLVEYLNQPDGPINSIGRSIEKDMAIGMSLGLEPCE